MNRASSGQRIIQRYCRMLCVRGLTMVQAAGELHRLGDRRVCVRARTGAARVRAQPAVSFFFSNSFTWPGLALPPVAFMTWPTK
jgi:hypothetical protein